jgi:hypothetical protein
MKPTLNIIRRIWAGIWPGCLTNLIKIKYLTGMSRCGRSEETSLQFKCEWSDMLILILIWDGNWKKLNNIFFIYIFLFRWKKSALNIFSIFYTHHRIPNKHMTTINFDTITNNYEVIYVIKTVMKYYLKKIDTTFHQCLPIWLKSNIWLVCHGVGDLKKPHYSSNANDPICCGMSFSLDHILEGVRHTESA